VGLALTVVGLAVVALIMFDAVATTVATTTAAGPVTKRVSLLMWRVAQRLSRAPDDMAMVAAGPAILAAFVVVWMLGLWVGWSLVFVGSGAVIEDATNMPAGIWSQIYFAGFTVFTLGTGDFRPDPAVPIFQLLTPVAAINGLAMATMAISYLIPVVSAVNEKRRQAALIHSLGRNTHDVLARAWDGDSLEFLDSPLMDLAMEIEGTAQKHLAYPVLHFFHSSDRTSAFAPSVAALSETITVLNCAVAEEVRPHTAVLETVQRSIGQLLGIVHPKYTSEVDGPPPRPDLDRLRDIGVPLVDHDEFVREIEQHDEQRELLLGFVEDAHWTWDAVIEGPDPYGAE
jgi:hypothetical protein